MLLQSQVSSLSPYSRFGLGQLLLQGGTASRGMGGVTAPLADRFFVNANNPASYSYLFRTAYDLNVRASFLQLETADDQADLINGSLNSAQFGFKKQGSRWGFGLGLRPFSTSGYDISLAEEDDEIGTIQYSYEGQGGISVAQAGSSFRFPIKVKKGLFDGKSTRPDSTSSWHWISFGANVEYYFGQLETIRRVNFFETGFYATRVTSSTDVGTVSGTLGIIGEFNLFNEFEGKRVVRKTDLMLAATVSPERLFNVGFEEVNESVFTTGLGSEVVVDTASWQPFQEGDMTIPLRMNVGFSLNHRDRQERRWKIMGDYLTQDWTTFTSDFDLLDGVSELQSFERLSLGVELTPRPMNDNSGALLKSSYRMGFRTTTSYVAFEGEDLSEMAFSGGLSLPVSQSKSTSKFHLGIEFGSRGTIENNLIRERFVNAFVGFSFSPIGNNNWFVERKYD